MLVVVAAVAVAIVAGMDAADVGAAVTFDTAAVACHCHHIISVMCS